MPDLILNCAFLTRTSGTDDPVFSAVTGKNRDPRDVLVDGQEVFYYRRYRSSKAGFENATGNWDATANSIVRTSVDSSSTENGTEPVSWGTGLQIVDISYKPEMLVGVDDPRLDNDDVDSMTPATELDGTEKSAFSQGGDPVSVTPQLLSPSAIIQAQGYNRGKVQSFTAMTHTPPLFSGTDQGMFGVEPIVCHMGNGGSVTQPAATSWPFRRGIASCNMSTNTASYAGVTSTNSPFYPDATFSDFYFGAVVGLTGLPTSSQRYVIGITPAPGNVIPTNGFYFQRIAGATNWSAHLNGLLEENIDTGIAPVAVNGFTLAWTTFEILTFSTWATVKFYIDKVLVADIAKASFYPPSAVYYAGAYCFQNGHNVANAMMVDALHCSITSAPGDPLGTDLL